MNFRRSNSQEVMKIFSAFFVLLLYPASCWAAYVKVCPVGPDCDPSEMVWLQIDPFGATMNTELLGIVVGGGLLLWSVGLGVGMWIQSIRKLR